MIIEMLDRGSARAAGLLFAIGARAALPALLTMVTLEVVLRYGFNSPLQWSRDVNGLLLLITLFATLPRAWDRGYHIRMEIVHRRLSGRWRSVADALSALAGLVFFGLMSIQAAGFARYMFVTGETGEDLNLLLWPFMVFVAVCGLVLCARLVVNPEANPAAGREAGQVANPEASSAAGREAGQAADQAAGREVDEDAGEADRWM